MARLIVKSPYIKCCGKGGGAEGYLKYIGTRERVEIVPDDRPPTRKQQQLIAKLVKDFPDTKSLDEYDSYSLHPTRVNASALISIALESNWEEVQRSEVYAKYIATRPRAEQLGNHGLFGDEDTVNLDAAMAELQSYTGNVWTHILSLKREDAVRLGYDNANAWRNLLRAHRNDIAAAMHIPPNDFRWYAAFHDEGDHPHVHMMAWSGKPGQAYLSKEGIREIRSKLTNDIFKYEMLSVYEQKSESRDELVREARRAVLDLAREIQNGICDHPTAERLMQDLAIELGTVKGKKSFGYLPKRLKKKVDEIVDEMERLPAVAECYDKWLELQWQVDSYYRDQRRERKKLSEEKEFRAIKNAVIREAERIRLGEVSFEDDGTEQEDEPEEFDWPSKFFWKLYQIIGDEEAAMSERDVAVRKMEQLANDGDADAQYTIAKLYRDGPLLIPDWVNAAYWFEKAARQGNNVAQYTLGKLLLSNDAEVRNIEVGLQWLAESARNGNSYAAYRLGKEFLRGEIVGKDAATAAQWFQYATEDGNQYAQYILAKLYLAGDGVKADKDAALYWMQGAADQGHRYAQLFLDRWDSLRTPSAMLSVTRLLHSIAGVFQEHTPALPVPGGIQIDRKRFAQLVEQKGYQAAREYAREEQEQQNDSGPTM